MHALSLSTAAGIGSWSSIATCSIGPASTSCKTAKEFSMDQHLISELGDELYAALRARKTLSPLTTHHPEISIDDAYHISLHMLQRRIAAGEQLVGKKIGVTSKAVQD